MRRTNMGTNERASYSHSQATGDGINYIEVGCASTERLNADGQKVVTEFSTSTGSLLPVLVL